MSIAMFVRLIIVILFFALYDTSFCESIIPPLAHNMITVKATLKTDPVQRIRLGSFVAEFEKTTLGEIRDTLGSGLIQHSGDAAQSQYWLCYSLSSQRIWLISHGEMGGSDHVLTQVQAISTISTSEVNAACPQIPTHFQPISSNFGWIGTSQNSLINMLGQPSEYKVTDLFSIMQGKSRDHIMDKEWNGT